MKDILKLLRVHHYIKNLLIFIPMFFGRAIFNIDKLLTAILGFITFCLVSSAVYIINDLKDVEKDRKHPTKKYRPLASGKVRKSTAIGLLLGSLLIACNTAIYIHNIKADLFLLLYFIANIAYSMGLKNIPVIDIIILASGFVIRIFYGGFITDVEVSKWLYLVVVTGSLYMGLGKRRNELRHQTDTRDVLQYYNESFLEKNMYVCVALADVFYSLWTIEMPNSKMSWTSPVFMILLMCYSLDVERDSDGDPVEVILRNKLLIFIIVAYAVCIFFLIYIVN